MSRNSFAMIEAGWIPGDLGAFKKEGGKTKLYDSGGGSAPTSTSTTSYTYPPELRDKVLDIANKAISASEEGYIPYPKQRIAGFDPYQRTAQQQVANLKPASQLGIATQYATAAGLKAGNVSYTPTQFQTGSFTQPGAAETYMSPYYQNVVDIQAREARRQSDIEAAKQNAQAVGQGAFGGSRSAIVEAERQRNLGQQIGDIQARGAQAAYEQAQNLYNTEQQRALAAQQATEASRQFGAGLSMQGLQQQLAAAGQLGTLGQTQFGQQKDIINALNAIGAQRQAMDQQNLSMQYEDWLKQKRHPYEQLAFATEMIKGAPTQTTQAIYSAPPSMASQAAGLGLATYGLFKAEGGSVSEYEEAHRPAGLGELALRNAQMKARR
jgi:hypothetical protein